MKRYLGDTRVGIRTKYMMSVVSSRISSVSSMLKNSEIRAQFIKKPDKICTLPKDVKDILYNYKGIRKKKYEKLIHSIKNDVIKDNNLAEFITEVMQYISLLDIERKLFVEALLQIDWTNRSSQVIFTYKLFLQNLACVQTFHTNIVINCLVELFKPKNIEHEIGQLKDEDVERLNHIHDILREILRVVPMSNKDLLEALETHFPFYLVHGTYIHEIYVYALLEILNYAPQLRRNILILIIRKLVTLDANVPCQEVNNDENMVEDDCISNGTGDNDNLTKINSDTDKSRIIHPTARILDSCLELFFKYMHEFCFVNDVLQMKNLEIMYSDIVYAFEKEILNMYGIRYVQYIVFYMCSFGQLRISTIEERFTNWLWREVVVKPNSTVPPIYRQTAVCYISSLLANASFISPQLVKTMISKLTQWLNEYITSQEYSEYIEDYARHAVFYSVCQAFFHLFVARYKHFVFDLKYVFIFSEKFLQNLSLSISKIVTCKLNPLKMCDTKIVHAFAQTTRTYGLAYCDSVIEYNERNQLPIFGMESHLPVLIPNFFPFESYTLEHSGRRIAPLFYNNRANIDCRSVNKCE
ncbi:RNA polymerase I-specific transcription initiation factor RRN3 [Trachymyrmex cornetzi]|uniref:RNA polymerase I-specific transcription initiation factor RRN3 n=1 Tax=Trachymyrmex cornetzi TaxID=471704 RepID=A0A195DXA6_9HYME|nr:RNA polymerase I-specific transcription initiation factor RRN3 [Trachymyrmex cornetzi]